MVLEDDWGERVHVGVDTQLVPTLRGKGSSEWRVGPPAHVAPTEEGPLTVQVSASRLGISASRPRSFVAVPFRTDPSFELAVGNQWEYDWSRTRDDSVWLRSHRDEDQLTLEVTDEEVKRGLRHFAVTQKFKGHIEKWWFYPADGTNYMVFPDSEEEKMREALSYLVAIRAMVC